MGGTRERKQTQWLDPADSTRSSPVEPAALRVEKMGDIQNASKRKRTAPQRFSDDIGETPAAKNPEHAWPAAWKKLLERSVPVPQDCLPQGAALGLQEPSYVQQMRGTRTRFYIGRPVQVLTDGKWEGGVLSSLEEVSSGKRRVMLSSGKEDVFEDLTTWRHDDLTSGGFSIGRHAQVMFDGGLWYVGVVAALQLNKQNEPTAATIHFEDGDRLQFPLPDASIELLPLEWSQHIEKKRKWGWWGYNKDRAEVAATKEAETRGEHSAAKKRPGKADITPAAEKRRGRPQKGGTLEPGEGKIARGNDGKEKEENDEVASGGVGALVRDESVVSEEVMLLMQQMRGSENGFYLGCPVEWKNDGDTWVKGSVVALSNSISGDSKSTSGDEKEGHTVKLREGGGGSAEVRAGVERLRFDHDSGGDVAVGRHLQLLFEGSLWYVVKLVKLAKLVKLVKLVKLGCGYVRSRRRYTHKP
jgi:hypothetical protein